MKIKKAIIIIITISACLSLFTILIDRIFITDQIVKLINYNDITNNNSYKINLLLLDKKGYRFTFKINKKYFFDYYNKKPPITLVHSVLLKEPIKIKLGDKIFKYSLFYQFHGLLLIAILCFIICTGLIPKESVSSKKSDLIDNRENSELSNIGQIFLYYLCGCITIFISSVLIYIIFTNHIKL